MTREQRLEALLQRVLARLERELGSNHAELLQFHEAAAMTRAIPHSRIESVKQSPLNARRWCLQLDCGHDQWMTSARRPTRQTIRCAKCSEKAATR